jgi:HAD superfamily hydrolase (TIGR01509 family)
MNRKYKVEAVIFDLDGTLLDSITIYARFANEVRRERGLPPADVEEVKSWLRGGRTDLATLMAKLGGGGWERLARSIPRIQLWKVELLPGVEELLPLLQARGIKMGIVTATDNARFMEWKLLSLREKGLDGLFAAIIGDEDVPRVKPAPDPIWECLKRLNVSPEQAIYLGDSPSDIKAGRSAGVITVGVLSGVSGYNTLMRESPDEIVETVAALPQILEFAE